MNMNTLENTQPKESTPAQEADQNSHMSYKDWILACGLISALIFAVWVAVAVFLHFRHSMQDATAAEISVAIKKCPNVKEGVYKFLNTPQGFGNLYELKSMSYGDLQSIEKECLYDQEQEKEWAVTSKTRDTQYDSLEATHK